MTTLERPAEAAQQVRSRAEYEDFLYAEAALLDEWRLDEWYALFDPSAIYEVPTAGARDDVSSAEALFYIADDYGRLGHRVARLNKKSAHSEYPRSKTSRLIGNVRVLKKDAQGTHVACTFLTTRSKDNDLHTFCGHINYVFCDDDGGRMRIASKRVFIDMSSLRTQGRVSIIL